MKIIKILMINFCVFTYYVQAVDQWSILDYMGSDNDLYSASVSNLTAMQKGVQNVTQTSILVQYDEPQNVKTWRFEIVPNNKVDVGSLNTEMGLDPLNEVKDAMTWWVGSYPATNRMFVFWDHGTGAKTVRSLNDYKVMPWEALLAPKKQKKRVILYDLTNNTVLEAPDLLDVCDHIAGLLSGKLKIMAFDACFMSMVEIAYQIKSGADIMVASQEIEPALGWDYETIFKQITLNPGTTPKDFATLIVNSFGTFYASRNEKRYTLAATDLSFIELIKDDIQDFIAKVAACKAVDATRTRQIVVSARQAATSFLMSDFIDLVSFYRGIKDNIPNGRNLPTSFKNAANALNTTVVRAINRIASAVFAKTSGPVFNTLGGLSIYFPALGGLHASYDALLFAQETGWKDFIQEYDMQFSGDIK